MNETYRKPCSIVQTIKPLKSAEDFGGFLFFRLLDAIQNPRKTASRGRFENWREPFHELLRSFRFARKTLPLSCSRARDRLSESGRSCSERLDQRRASELLCHAEHRSGPFCAPFTYIRIGGVHVFETAVHADKNSHLSKDCLNQ